MTLTSNLHSTLQDHLSDEDIDSFADGEVALFISEPKYAFYRTIDGEYQRADVVQEHNPDGDVQMQIYHEVYQTTSTEVQDRLSDVTDISVVPVEAGFGGI